MKLTFAAIAVVIACIAGPATAAHAAGPVFPRGLPACATEDSDNCYWDATKRGNHIGRSFYVIDGHLTYVLTGKKSTGPVKR